VKISEVLSLVAIKNHLQDALLFQLAHIIMPRINVLSTATTTPVVDQINCSLVVNLQNHRQLMLLPMELFSNSCMENYNILKHLDVWGYPCYILGPKLQDSKK
jgi:hypothetical protein